MRFLYVGVAEEECERTLVEPRSTHKTSMRLHRMLGTEINTDVGNLKMSQADAEMRSTRRNIVFVHPDLGIGGAERLVIDAAVGLQSQGHKVTILTSHCDPSHCFEEARDGE